LIGNFGISDRIDVGVAMPLVRLQLSGTRIDTYRGTALTQAVASGSATGAGDLIVRAKYNGLRVGASGLALVAEARLPTGNEQNLLGSGEATITPRFVASWEGTRAGLHGNLAGGPRIWTMVAPSPWSPIDDLLLSPRPRDAGSRQSAGSPMSRRPIRSWPTSRRFVSVAPRRRPIAWSPLAA
jgi:hypothetical protein